ncbi:hypothetical protein F4819DRAFT_475940 [Hypoxylon fuscum]|nr:hypothetical protein F4819DRAFT_475940 [Hypoxylon fuscum]
MEPQTPSVLQFSDTFHPSITDAESVIDLLRRKVPFELVIQIFSLGYNPWVAKRRVHEREYRANYNTGDDYNSGDGYSVAGLYLSTERIPNDARRVLPQRVIFQTRAADQGWATFGGEGTFENSHTWFETRILRPFPGNQDVTLDVSLLPTWWDVAAARGALRESGWDFVEGEGGHITWRVCNNITACSEYRDYKVEWRRGIQTEVEDERAVGRGEGFVELLKPGFVVVLWARAEQGAWRNKVGAATIEIEYSL